MKIEYDLYNEIIDITYFRQYKFTMSDGRIGWFSANYRELGSQESGDIDILIEDIHAIRWSSSDDDDDLPTIEQITECFSVNGVEVTG
jgi:hypothetical protein